MTEIKAHLYDVDDTLFPCVAESVLIPGPAGSLETQTSCPDDVERDAVVIICHPHPLYGGSLQNKVVHYIARTLNQVGVHSVRFNFRGVGQSSGEYDQGRGELEDLLAVAEWTRSRLPGHALWLAGFSFGACIALRAAATLHPVRLITVAPAVNLLDCDTLPDPGCDWLLVQGEEDEIVPPEQVRAWARAFPSARQQWLPHTGHFFHGRLKELQEILLKFVQPDGEKGILR